MSNTIPDDIQKKIDDRYPNPEGLTDILFDTRRINAAKRSGATFGYQLSREELEAKDKEIERLESEQRITESQLIIAEDGVQRLKGLIRETHDGYVLNKYARIDVFVNNTQLDELWLQFCKDNGL